MMWEKDTEEMLPEERIYRESHYRRFVRLVGLISLVVWIAVVVVIVALKIIGG